MIENYSLNGRFENRVLNDEIEVKEIQSQWPNKKRSQFLSSFQLHNHHELFQHV